MMSSLFRTATALAFAGLLPGCSAISALDAASQPLEIYELRTPQDVPAVSRRNIEVVVEEPAASGALATERIMIKPSPLQAQYLPGVRWADNAPVMLQTLIVRSLTESGAFASVGRRPVGTIPDVSVLSELTDFQAELSEETGTAVVRQRLIVRLVRESDERVVATRIFSEAEASPTTDEADLIAAFDRASARLLGEATTWIASNAGGR